MSDLSKVYTHPNHGGIGKEDPLYPKRGSAYQMKTRAPEYADVMSAYVADFPQVKAAVSKVATGMALVASAQLARFDSGGQKRSSNPRIELSEGDRSDMFVLLVVGPEGSPRQGEATSKKDERGLAAAWSIEYGRLGYTDRKGRYQPAAPGAGPLHAALAAVGWGG